jgi:sortase A
MGTTLRWVERSLFIVAALCLAYVVLTRSEAAYYRTAAREMAAAANPASDATNPLERIGTEFDLTVGDRAPVRGAAGPAPALTRPPVSLLGELAIPHLGISTAILEGDDSRALRRGVEHVPGTARPGEAGNTVLAGHRDTVFRRLSEIQRGDRLRVTTADGTFDYRVSRTLRVMPRDVWVLDADAASLTLITCYPFTWVGSAPERWIVQAEPAARNEGIQ